MRKRNRYVLLALFFLGLVLCPSMIFATAGDNASSGSGTSSDPYVYTIDNFYLDFSFFGNPVNPQYDSSSSISSHFGIDSFIYHVGSLNGLNPPYSKTRAFVGNITFTNTRKLSYNNEYDSQFYPGTGNISYSFSGVGSFSYGTTLKFSIYGYVPDMNVFGVYVTGIAPATTTYYNDISSVSSFTDDDGMVFYTGGLSLIATAAPNFYNALLGADGLATWLSSDVEAMFMYDPTNDEWYIMNAPQNLAYFADDHNSVTTLYSGYIDSDNNFVADSRSGSFNQVDITTYTATSGCYKWDGTTWYWSPTYNNVQVGRNANGFYVNRGSSITRLAEAPNVEREAVIRGLTINNPFIAHNGDLIAQYLQTEDNRETVVDGDLYALLNSIKNWEQVDAITQKYLLLAINDVASLTGQVIDYLGPNYQYPTITSYLDSLFAFNGFKYFAYDVNGDTVEYNTNNHPIASALTEFYLMTTTLDNTGRPASTYSYDGQNRVNPLSSLWNDIKNLPQAIANALEPIFPTIPDNNDTIIDTIGDYYNPVSLNPSNMTMAHDGMTDAMEFYNYQAPEGVSFIGIFSDPDRWTLFTEETLNNCGLYIEEGE